MGTSLEAVGRKRTLVSSRAEEREKSRDDEEKV
jgi:hypothetical protein